MIENRKTNINILNDWSLWNPLDIYNHSPQSIVIIFGIIFGHLYVIMKRKM